MLSLLPYRFEPQMDKKQRIIRQAVAFFIFVLITGCTSSRVQPVKVVRPELFPPQAVIKSGGYKGFLDQNSATLKSCPQPDQCTVALFNLCFLYCYPKSPYYNPQKALKYISDLTTGAPESPWAAQAMVWRELTAREMKAKNRGRLLARKSLQSKQTDLENKTAMEKDWEVERQILQDEIRCKDEIIKELTRQIKGSRKIDLEIEKKEKGLLH